MGLLVVQRSPRCCPAVFARLLHAKLGKEAGSQFGKRGIRMAAGALKPNIDISGDLAVGKHNGTIGKPLGGCI
ncbi:hypothetical protein [Phyllobacterium zundukense]|uniref:hypothetical protein n=1 Tax=Phyllobacterium zundukense TaxID=1867719 RepID=UPI000C4F50DE|nr:hypothetical protein [Phyllobacterium zundukense]ATU95464.1 hypothetical protein BLM14_27680 [Phyllobacterium zundukense]